MVNYDLWYCVLTINLSYIIHSNVILIKYKSSIDSNKGKSSLEQSSDNSFIFFEGQLPPGINRHEQRECMVEIISAPNSFPSFCAKNCAVGMASAFNSYLSRYGFRDLR